MRARLEVYSRHYPLSRGIYSENILLGYPTKPIVEWPTYYPYFILFIGYYYPRYVLDINL